MLTMWNRLIRRYSKLTRIYKQKWEIAASSLFDASFYADRQPDTRTTADTALSYYVRCDLRQGPKPSAHFDPELYLRMNPDGATAGEAPFLSLYPTQPCDGRPLPDERPALAAEIKASNLFDPDFYFALYPDVALAGLDPLYYVLLHGVEEGRAKARNHFIGAD